MDSFPEQNPSHYKWGFFYYNPHDSRVWVPKANPVMGMTLNFANPKSLWWSLLLLALPITTALLAFLL